MEQNVSYEISVWKVKTYFKIPDEMINEDHL